VLHDVALEVKRVWLFRERSMGADAWRSRFYANGKEEVKAGGTPGQGKPKLVNPAYNFPRLDWQEPRNMPASPDAGRLRSSAERIRRTTAG